MVVVTMKYKLIFGFSLLILFSTMNIYSKALRYVSMKDVKQKHQEKFIEKKIREEENKKIVEELKYKNSPSYSNWRNEISEQMTTTDVFYTNLPATGDVNLAYPAWNILTGQGYSVSGRTLNIGAGEYNDGAIASFDSSVYSNLVFDVSISGSSIFGVFAPSGDLLVISQSPGTYSVNIEQSPNLNLLFLASGVNGSVSISNLRFQRRTPISVFVSLDSPEAVSFVRLGTGPTDLSPKERHRKVMQQLTASKNYTEKQFGSNFPGSNFSGISDVEASPIGKEASYDTWNKAAEKNAQQAASTFNQSQQSTQGFDISKMEKDYGKVSGLYGAEISALVDIVLKSPEGPTRDGAYKTLQQNIKPGSRNHQLIKSLGINLGI